MVRQIRSLTTTLASKRQEFDAKTSTSKWVLVSIIVSSLATSEGKELLQWLRPDTAGELAAMNKTLALLERDVHSLARATWRLGGAVDPRLLSEEREDKQ
ncbi:MAG: hypothetical protein E6R03_16180 [Hyphomicrobiaceae bacterium]|nr:MAG: hypothetical protein E6R03_16180 [Hyphomicrobiaceae bacterium]